MVSKKRFSFLLILSLLYGSIALFSCVSTETAIPEVLPETVSAVTITKASPVPTSSPAISTQRPTKIPPSAPSGLPPTWTPLPTYPPEQAVQIAMDLFENSPCNLPCWWGITPGKTDWREAWQFLERFAANKPPWDNLLLESKYLPGYMYYQVLLNVPETTEEAYYSSLNHLVFVIDIDTFKVDYIDVNTGNIAAYTIPKILATYGKPQEIYVMVGGSQVPQYSGVSVLLYYPQYGFISNHFTTVNQEQSRESRFTACFQKVTNLYLWPQEQSLEFEKRLKISGFANVDASLLSLFDSINEVSDFSVETFYQTYVNLQEQPCIEFKNPNQK